jgi:DNA helicase II / ATP-dependent DNA helicase PcrA
MFDCLEGLNEAQRRAATSDSRALLVVAGAGSGKTNTLATRVAHLIASGAPPNRILLLTFTRRAAREMLARAERLAGHSSPGRVWGGTFHSVANRLLRMYSSAVGLDPSFTVMDQADGADMMNLIRSELGLASRRRRFPKKATLATIYSAVVNTETRLEEILERRFPWCGEEGDSIGDLFSAYMRRKREQGVLDYDDLLLYWRALTESPRAGPAVAAAFDHILVDEYQDTNEIQAAILRNMCTESNSVMVVGDDAQAIYSFRSATVANILDFPKHHPGCEIVKLEQNYRSTQPILDASNAVIAGARRRYTKELWTARKGDRKPALTTCMDESDEAEVVCNNVLELRERGTRLQSQAVLFRAGYNSAQLEIELGRRNIPYVKYGGLRFVEAAHIKDVLALLRILENPFDELSWFRVLLLLDGVGAATAHRLLEELGVRPRATPEEGPLERLHTIKTVPDSAAGEVAELGDALGDCAQIPGPEAQIERLRTFYEPVMQRVHSAAPSRARDLDQLAAIASGYSSREGMISDLMLDPPAATGDLAGPPHLDEDYLILSTIHSAKGCEWDAVHVIHAADGVIPSDMATGDQEEIDEELRLFYVALTRARNDLCLYFPLRFYFRRHPMGDAHSFAQLTRFLPPELLHLFDQRSSARREAEAVPFNGDVSAGAPVDEILERLWR